MRGEKRGDRSCRPALLRRVTGRRTAGSSWCIHALVFGRSKGAQAAGSSSCVRSGTSE